jgi:hypothetical protein
LWLSFDPLHELVLFRLDDLGDSFSSVCLFLLGVGLTSVEIESLVVDCRLWWIGDALSVDAGLVIVCCSGNGDAASGNAIVHSSAISPGDNDETSGSGDVH